MAAPSLETARRGVSQLAGRRDARVLARVGLAGRTGFYLLLAYLTARVAAQHGSAPQANAHGALAIISSSVLGKCAIAAVAAGFAVLGAVRVAAAVRDREANTRQRVTTGLQGGFYVVLATVPASFLLGRSTTGSEQQQHREAGAAFSLPLGRWLVGAAGVVVVGICVWQVVGAVRQDFTDGMDIGGCATWVRRTIVVAGTAGIAARALVFAPVGCCLVASAVQSNPSTADGLDAELLTLARQPYGPWLLGAITLGLLVFAAYSGLETRYREVGSSR